MKVRKGSINYFLIEAPEKSINEVVRFEDFTYHSYKHMRATKPLKLKKDSVLGNKKA